MSGICTSISTRSNAARRDRRRAPRRPLPATDDRVAALLQQADGELLVDDVVLGEQDAQRAARARPATGGRAATRRIRSRRVEQGREQVGLLDRLDERGADAQLAAAGQVVGLARRGEHDEDRPRQGRHLPHLPRQREAVHVRHVGVEQQERVGLARLGGPAQLGQGERALSTTVAFMSQPASTSSRRRRFVAWSSTARTRSPASDAIGRGTASGGGAASGSRAVKVNVEPRPGLAGDGDPAAHEFDELRRDGQAEAGAAEAARRRAVGLLERLEDRADLVRRDADAGVAHLEAQQRRPRGRRGRSPRRRR